jgi:type III secretory pathway component EscS
MDDRRRTLAAITVIIGFLVLVSIVVGLLVSRNNTLSPVPEDNAIKIIIVSPTLVPTVTPSVSPRAEP